MRRDKRLSDIQCGDKLVLDKNLKHIFYCIRRRNHEGIHMSLFGYPKIKYRVYWENYKIK